MPATNGNSRRAAIRGLLLHSVGGAATVNASMIGNAVAGIWDRFNAQLAPVIGARGTAAIFGRAERLTSAAFPWLKSTGNPIDIATPQVRLEASFASQEASAATEAGVALLVNFTNLLATLIGEALTDRLLRPVLANSPFDRGPETPP